MCEFQFEENMLGSIYDEVKTYPDIAFFLVETTYFAFASGRSGDLTEPFPSFLLHRRELRPKTGNLEHIKKAQES